MEVRELLGRFSHPKFGIKRMTMYGVPVSEWVSDLSFLDWCRMQGERSGFWAMEDVFDWARENQEVVRRYAEVIGLPSASGFDLYDFLEEVRGWHIKELLLDEYESFMRYATLKHLDSLGVESVGEYELEKLLKKVYEKRPKVCFEDIFECVEEAIQNGEI